MTPKVEWEFVLHSARLPVRAAWAVTSWAWISCEIGSSSVPSMGISPGGLGGEIDPLKLMRRSSLVVADLPVSPVSAQMPTEMKSGGHRQQPPPTVFEEPDSNSLLDSFGF